MVLDLHLNEGKYVADETVKLYNYYVERACPVLYTVQNCLRGGADCNFSTVLSS